MFGFGLLAIMFSVFNYFRNPQINSEKIDAVIAQRLSDIEAKITAFGSAFQGHIQSDINSFGSLNNHIVEVDKSVVKLTTIIEERIPKKRK